MFENYMLCSNQQRSPEQGNAQRLSCKGVEPQAIGGSKRWMGRL